MAGYIGSKASVVSSGAEHKKVFNITTTTTSLTGLVYTPTLVHVFHNGVRLVDGTDYTATTGTSITLTVAAQNGDQVVVISYATFQTSDTVSSSAGGTFAGDVSVTGAFTSLGIDDNATSTAITIDASGNVGIGTVPTANNISKSISLVNGGSIFGYGSGTYVTGNSNYNGAWNTVATGVDSRMLLDGNVVFSRSASASAGTAGAVTESMRINSSGNVGIGTNSPQARLQVSQAANLSLTNSDAQMRIEGNGYTGFFGLDGTSFQIGQNSSLRSMTFHSGSGMPERMRIDSSGNVLVGTAATAFAAKQYVESSTNCIAAKTTASANTYEAFVGSRDGNAGKVATWWYNNSSQVGSISITASSTAYVTSSDYRLKTDAQPMTGASARVQALKPVNFEWISDGTRVDGFLAHEAQEIVPEAVTGTKDAMRDEEYEVTAAIEATYDEDGNELTAAVEAVMGTRSVPDYQGIDQSKLVPLLTAALQEALTKIASMETRLAALEAL